MSNARPEPAAIRRRPPLRGILDLLRGFLIGMAELVPGVSGGTVALVTGVYDELIDSASHVLAALRALVLGPDRWSRMRAELARSDWWLLVPVFVGMAAAVLTMAGVMGAFVGDHPEHARGLFLGLVAASVAVPLMLLPPRARGSRALDALWLIGGAVAAFLLTGLAGGREVEDPALVWVFLAAAVAICALVVPGVSGSFFLLAVGLYAPTLAAVDERNLVYIAVFAAGAAVGLGSFVQILQYLLNHRRRTTLLVMAGLMIGSLRALWPWQEGQAEVDGETKGTGTMVAPYDPLGGPILLAGLGAAVVVLLIWVERRAARRSAAATGSGSPASA